FDDKDFALGRVAFLTVRKFSWKRARIECAFPTRQLFCLACSFTSARGVETLLTNSFCFCRMLFEVGTELFIDQRFNEAFYFAVAEFGLCLPFELWFRNFGADDCGEPLTDVFSLEPLLVLFEQTIGNSIGIYRPRERGFQTDKMGSSLNRIDVI